MTKVMILICEWVSCPVPWVPDYRREDGECMTEFSTRLNRGQVIEASLQEIWKSHSIPISTKIWLMKALVWPVATYGCESWTLRKNEETRLDAFEMKGLRRMLRVSWTAKKTNELYFRHALCFIFVYNCGLTVRNKRICYVMLWIYARLSIMHFNWKCRLMQVDLYNGRKMVVVVAVKRQVVTLTVLHLCISILPKMCFISVQLFWLFVWKCSVFS